MSAFGNLTPSIVAAVIVFSFVNIGTVLPNPTLLGIDGVERSLLAEGTVSAFIFLNPEQEHSLEVLGDLAELRNEMAEKPIAWIAVVSDRFSTDTVRSVISEAGLEIETIVDTGDRLYGELGVRLYPSIGIADREGSLQAYLPFTKVNYMQSVRAHLLHALGEFDDDQLKDALHPKDVKVTGNDAVANRNISFARMLLEAGKPDKALAKARDAVEASPDSAEAQALVSLILAQQGNCDAAQENLQRALEIDPENATAQEAFGLCG